MAYLIFGLAVLGHTTLWISVINRLHARPWPESLLRKVRHLHDVCVLLFPILLVIGAGWLGPQLLRGGSWLSLDWLWITVFGVCGSGCVWLAFVVVRHWLERSPRQLTSETSHGIDVAAELGERPISPGPYHVLATIPWNEQFTLEVTRKTFTLPRLPEGLDGMRIWHLSDWHFLGTIERRYYERVVREIQTESADLFCFTGDLIDRMECLDWLDTTFATLDAPAGKLFILGNHDWNQRPEEVRERMQTAGWIDVASRVESLTIRGIPIAVGGDETPWMGTEPDFSSVPESTFRLLLSHTPDNLARARRAKIDLMLSGHTHGGQVRLPLIGPVFSPSRSGVRYASGTFWKSPTLLHVSRGLAGQHPLRWNCRPEVTLITLRRG